MADGSWGATLIEKERGKHREKGGLCVHPILSNPAQVLRDPGLSSVVAAWTEVWQAGRNCTGLEKRRLACSCLVGHPDCGNRFPGGHQLCKYDKEWQKKKKRKKKKGKELWVPDDHLQEHPKVAVLGDLWFTWRYPNSLSAGRCAKIAPWWAIWVMQTPQPGCYRRTFLRPLFFIANCCFWAWKDLK